MNERILTPPKKELKFFYTTEMIKETENCFFMTAEEKGKVSNSSDNGGFTRLVRYKPQGSNDDCIITATGEGVTFSKTGMDVKFVVPKGVMITSAQIKFSADEMVGPACKINYGMGESYDDLYMPIFQVATLNDGNKPYSKAAAGNLTTGPSTIQISGLIAGQPTMIKLLFM